MDEIEFPRWNTHFINPPTQPILHEIIDIWASGRGGETGGFLFERTYHKGLMELGTQETFLPIITHGLPNSFGHALLDGQGIPGQVIRELRKCRMVVLGRRREALIGCLTVRHGYGQPERRPLARRLDNERPRGLRGVALLPHRLHRLHRVFLVVYLSRLRRGIYRLMLRTRLVVVGWPRTGCRCRLLRRRITRLQWLQRLRAILWLRRLRNRMGEGCGC